MKNVFIDKKGVMSLDKKEDSVSVGKIHRFQGSASFEEAIEVANWNEMTAYDLTREHAFKASQSPYTSKANTLVYVDDIKPI